jgi:hypothetical protein
MRLEQRRLIHGACSGNRNVRFCTFTPPGEKQRAAEKPEQSCMASTVPTILNEPI